MKYKYFLFITMFLAFQIVFSQEKIVSEIRIEGAKKTKLSFLKQRIQTQINTPLDSLVLKKDIIELKRLPAVTNATFIVKDTQENLCTVLIQIEENFTIIPDASFWVTTNNRFAYRLGVYEYNFLGKNITIGGFYQNNGFDTYALNFKAPNLFSKKWGLAINHQNWKSEEPLYFGEQTANYLYNNIATEVLGLYQINFKNKFDFGVNFFKEKYSYLSGATSTEVPQSLNVNKTLFKFIYAYDNLDYYYQYISGFRSVFYGQYVFSDNNFQDTFLVGWNDFFYYKRVGEKGNWANRLRVGLATNNNSPFAPFALDNNVNIRGVGILVDRGTGSIVLNSEYRYTFYDKKNFAIQSNVFLDAGSWRTPGGSLNDFTQIENMQFFSGIGLRCISKKIYNATFRIDYGFSLQNNSRGLVFGLGQYF